MVSVAHGSELRFPRIRDHTEQSWAGAAFTRRRSRSASPGSRRSVCLWRRRSGQSLVARSSRSCTVMSLPLLRGRLWCGNGLSFSFVLEVGSQGGSIRDDPCFHASRHEQHLIVLALPGLSHAATWTSARCFQAFSMSAIGSSLSTHMAQIRLPPDAPCRSLRYTASRPPHAFRRGILPLNPIRSSNLGKPVGNGSSHSGVWLSPPPSM